MSSALIYCHSVSKTFSAKPLFSGLSFGIQPQERLGIVGANGSGKSTLLRMLADLDSCDEGRISRKSGARVAYVSQQDHFGTREEEAELTPRAVLVRAAQHLGMDETEAEVAAAQQLTKLRFADPEAPVATLAGGWRKRLGIAQAMIGRTDLVLLDEPTNHLDWDGINWLAGYLNQSQSAWVMVSHDRSLLDRCCRRVLSLDPQLADGYMVSEGGYEAHLTARAERLAEERARTDSLQSRLRREEAWLAQGAKARSTKAKHRIAAAEELRSNVSESRARQRDRQTAGLDFGSGKSAAKKVLSARGLAGGYGDTTIIRDFDFELSRGRVVGILGANGSGKSTLMKLLMGDLPPGSGELTHAHDTRCLTFDQHRESLPAHTTLGRALVEEGDHALFQGRSIHVSSWAARFGFRPDALDTPTEKLSGGEKARVLIARLMLQEADLLALDEPTNDLDIPTIEQLEDALETFPGSTLVISHDRYFLERVSDAFIGLMPHGQALVFASIEQWEEARAGASSPRAKTKSASSKGEAKPKTSRARKASYKEKREFEGMEETILGVEGKLEELRAQVSEGGSDPELYRTLHAAEQELSALYERWAELSALIEG